MAERDQHTRWRIFRMKDRSVAISVRSMNRRYRLGAYRRKQKRAERLRGKYIADWFRLNNVDPHAPAEFKLPIVTHCQWHPDAGFCVDELREVTHWRERARPVEGVFAHVDYNDPRLTAAAQADISNVQTMVVSYAAPAPPVSEGVGKLVEALTRARDYIGALPSHDEAIAAYEDAASALAAHQARDGGKS